MSENTQEELGQLSSTNNTANTVTTSNTTATTTTTTTTTDSKNSSNVKEDNICVKCFRGSFKLCKDHVLTPTFVLVCGVGCSSLLILEGFLCFSLCSINLRSYTLAFYYICFGLMTISAELQIQQLLEYFRILESYFGKGLWYLFLGIAAIGSEWWAVLIAILVICVGVINLVGSVFLPPRKLSNPGTYRGDINKHHQSRANHNNLQDTDDTTTGPMIYDDRTQLSITQSSIMNHDEGITSSQDIDGITRSNVGLSSDQQSSLVRNAVNPSTIAAIHQIASDEHVKVAMEDAVEVNSNPFTTGAYD